MNKINELRTNRLLLRQWKRDDFSSFAEINADPEVMKFYPSTLTENESNSMAEKIMSLITENSWGFWAAELIKEKKFIGFVGLNQPAYKLPVNPCVEIGWRLAKEYWGSGYATEGAIAALRFAYESLNLDEVYSFASVNNKKSVNVMKRLGMKNTYSNFVHPIIPENNPLREHVLYKLSKKQWQENNLS